MLITSGPGMSSNAAFASVICTYYVTTFDPTKVRPSFPITDWLFTEGVAELTKLNHTVSIHSLSFLPFNILILKWAGLHSAHGNLTNSKQNAVFQSFLSAFY